MIFYTSLLRRSNIILQACREGEVTGALTPPPPPHRLQRSPFGKINGIIRDEEIFRARYIYAKKV